MATRSDPKRVLALHLLLTAALALACGGPTDRPAGAPPTADHVLEALQEPDPLARAERLAGIYQRLPADQLEGVKRAYDGGYFDLGDTELVLLAEWWGRFDGPGAVRWTQQSFVANTEQVRQAVLRAWARTDPEGALRYAEAQKADKVRGLWIDAVLSGWEESGQPGAFEFVRAMGEGENRQRAIAALTRRKVLRDGVDAAFDWAEALPEDDDRFKLNVIRRVGSASAEIDPFRASERAAALANGPYADGLLRRVGVRWAKQPGQGEAAMRWILSLPASTHLDDAAGETWRSWVRGPDRQEAIRYFEDGAPNDPKLDHAVALYAQLIAKQDPIRALELTRRIREEDFRWASLGRVWRLWWVQDSTAADSWWNGAEAEIPEFYRKRIQQIPAPMRRAQQRREAEQAADAS